MVRISMVRDGAPDSASALPETPPHHEVPPLYCARIPQHFRSIYAAEIGS
jgi:hypothetical protein